MAENTGRNIPLCVDLDGSLIATDSLQESVIQLVKKNPLKAFLLPFWMMKGKPYFKERVKDHFLPDPKNLPYRSYLLEHLAEEKAAGRELVLITASCYEIARKVADHLGIFDKVVATDGKTNMRGKNKKEYLVGEYGEKGFDYIGDNAVDLPVWQSAREAILVEPSGSLADKARKSANVTKVFKSKKNYLRLFIKEIRVYQWVKNILIFLPLLMAHKITESALYFDAMAAFFAFSFSASAVYIFNDILDIESDRIHPSKRKRPIASGDMPITAAILFVPVLFSMGIGAAWLFLPGSFMFTLVTYILLTTGYSIFFKKLYIIDIIILASLYTLRLFAGAFAVNVPATPWLLAFSMFLFLSLAIVKRFTELTVLQGQSGNETHGRGYIIDDLHILRSIGPASGYLSVLVFALYIHGGESPALYTRPELLWAITPLLLYWITRIWFLAQRGKMDDDPIVFTCKDPVSYAIGVIVVLLVIGASL